MLEAFDIDLAELRLAVAGDESVQTDERHVDHGVPANPLESSISLDIVHPGFSEGRDSRRPGTQMELSFAWSGCHSTGINEDILVAAVKQPQHGNEVRLRLDRDHAGTNAAEDEYSIAHMRTDVESKITGVKELPVERLQPAAAPNRAV